MKAWVACDMDDEGNVHFGSQCCIGKWRKPIG